MLLQSDIPPVDQERQQSETAPVMITLLSLLTAVLHQKRVNEREGATAIPRQNPAQGAWVLATVTPRPKTLRRQGDWRREDGFLQDHNLRLRSGESVCWGARVSEITRRFLEQKCTRSVPNRERLAKQSHYPLSKVAVTRTTRLDGCIKWEFYWLWSVQTERSQRYKPCYWMHCSRVPLSLRV